MRTILAGLLLCIAFAVGLAGSEAHAQPKTALKTELNAEPTAEDIARGKALTDAGNCAGCHTADPAKPFAGGKRIDSPFGGIYSANLTPDRETGLGAWSDDDFLRALRLGVGRDGSRYYPAFPYPHFTRLTRQDILAIRAHLATQPPVRNPPRAAELRFPFNWRFVMRGWNWLFLTPGFLMPDQMKSAEWNRGRYLVEGVAHCGSCHTPKNVFGADKSGAKFAGGVVQGTPAPRLDATEQGLKSWSVEDITAYLQNGRNGKKQAGRLMSEVVTNSTSKMSEGDLRAIAVYLKDLPQGSP
jgi:mono/diheme cytochrome c family protein